MKKHIFSLVIIIGLYLGLHNGYLALYRQQEAPPLQVFPYRAALYPKIDQKALFDGIAVADYQELERLMADLMS